MSSTDEQMKMWCTYIMEYYAAMKKNEIVSAAATRMQLEIVILSEVSQKEKDKYHMIPLICGIQNMTQINLSIKQNDEHREQIGGCQERRSWGKDGVGSWG